MLFTRYVSIAFAAALVSAATEPKATQGQTTAVPTVPGSASNYPDESTSTETPKATQGQTTEEPTVPGSASNYPDESKTSETPKATQGQTTAVPTVPGSASNYPDQTKSVGPSGYFNTSIATQSNIETTLVTITSCHEDKCSEVPSTAQVSIATTTISGVVTQYTTYCPLSTTDSFAPPVASPSGSSTDSFAPPVASPTASSTDSFAPPVAAPTSGEHVQTTLVTVTSCKDNKCTEVPSTAQVSVATSTVNGVETSYTTYCPISSTDSVAPPVASPTSGSAAASTHVTNGSTVVKPSGSTAAPKGSTVAPSGSTPASSAAQQSKAPGSSVAGVSTYEGSAAKVVAGSFFGVLPFLFI
ncbi:Immunoglobulin superfamily member [Wickerhamomyces ciferrii]|uniref:Immunoglobulin superfamily member n=1 Tax=Wickerhamomyces ciferrii (strain ATCC 14091 / BCRC 22168 / CBS 111 / JCM 3599 / NBRC 0793 / NRRL Y-1031 F-60-10) TaxID=1206466 RepID=K0KLL8_WICCF|nr:Immunoglobulin superfamily member [Wickerhamomyces ciferrii]CCH43871.1 Immunoglobulin superfamily member [Wickerhamomyces ciferrii]